MAAFDFSSRDFDTIKRDLLARADRVFPEWTDRDPSDFGMLFLDLWAYAADVLHFYIDRAAGEAFLDTATQRESVLALANLFDYVPRSRTSAVATLSLTNSTNADYVIAPYTEFIARNDNKTYQVYTPLGGVAASAGSSNITVNEGALTLDEAIGTSSGLGGQRFSLANTGAVVGSIVVSVFEDGVNAITYQRVARLATADTGERVFSTNVTADGAMEIVFGTTLNGLIPPSGARITATYAVSSGATGNLPANSVAAFKSVSPTGITIVSTSAFSGGLDEESITSLKRSIPTVISAQNRAVTANDFVSLAMQVEGVSKAAIAFTPGVGGNASVTIYPQPNRSDFLITSDVSQPVTTAMQADVIATIQPRALLGVTVLCAPTITWDTINLSADIHVNERFVAAWVKSDVQDALDELFAFDNVFFGQRFTQGQVYRIILNVPGVDYATITVFDNTGTTLKTDFTINALQLPKKGTVTLTAIGGITSS